MLSRKKIYTYFDQNFDGLIRSTNGWYSCTCPYCGRDKLAVHLDYARVKCWKGCVNSYIPYFVKDYEGVSYLQAIEILETQQEKLVKIPFKVEAAVKSDVVLPEGYRSILEDSLLGDKARKYLTDRGFDLNYLDAIGIGYCNQRSNKPQEDYFGFIIIPFRRDKKLAYYIGRNFIAAEPRYKNPAKEKFGVGKADVLFNEQALYLHDKIYVTEGWADAASCGDQGVSIQGLQFSRWQYNSFVKSPVKEIVMIPDKGAYKDGLKNVRRLVEHKKVKVLNLDDFDGKDVNEIGFEKIKKHQYEFEYLTMRKWYKTMRNAKSQYSY